MKKLLFTAAIAVIGFTQVSAQDFSYGVKAGLNIATLSGDDIENNDPKLGLHIGATGEYMVTEKFAIQADLLYSMQGLKQSGFEEINFNGETSRLDLESDVKLNYINLPIMFKYYITKGFNVELGPQVGFLVSAKADVELKSTSSITGTETIKIDQDIKDQTKSVDFALAFGLGYKFDSGLNLGARFAASLGNAFEDTSNSGSGDTEFDATGSDARNGVISFSVGYMF
ncbi:porin family protein [Bizionia sediminis]|uniref:Porin family protein n=1 Tax=Bizionia sediminis TaxID=1737064 RepID=A0ABW5KV36_9FLAO